MTYATRADMEQRFGVHEVLRLCDRAGNGGVDDVVLDQALADADAEVDLYLAARYALPLPVVPGVLARVACDVARYRLWADQASDEVRRRYEDAVRLLTAISKGVVALGLPGSHADVQPSLASVSAGPVKVFGRERTQGF